MASSAVVSAGDTILASQYNNLRTDAIHATTGAPVAADYLMISAATGATVVGQSVNEILTTFSEAVEDWDTLPSASGSQFMLNFNGTDEEGTGAAGATAFDWSSGSPDAPVSLVCLVKVVSDGFGQTIVSDINQQQ